MRSGPRRVRTSLLWVLLLLVATTAAAEELLTKRSHLTPDEQVRQAKQMLATMKTASEQSKKLAERARSEKDIIKLNCVNDKGIQITVHVKYSEGVLVRLQEAIARSDNDGADHESAKLTISYQKVTVLSQEAEACVGEALAYIGQTKVAVETDPDVDKQGEVWLEGIDFMPVFRPPLASPFK